MEAFILQEFSLFLVLSLFGLSVCGAVGHLFFPDSILAPLRDTVAKSFSGSQGDVAEVHVLGNEMEVAGSDEIATARKFSR